MDVREGGIQPGRPDDLMGTQPESSTQEVLAGLVERVTYHNAENGFCVLRAKARGHRDVVTMIDATPAWSGVDFYLTSP